MSALQELLELGEARPLVLKATAAALECRRLARLIPACAPGIATTVGTLAEMNTASQRCDRAFEELESFVADQLLPGTPA